MVKLYGGTTTYGGVGHRMRWPEVQLERVKTSSEVFTRVPSGLETSEVERRLRLDYCKDAWVRVPMRPCS